MRRLWSGFFLVTGAALLIGSAGSAARAAMARDAARAEWAAAEAQRAARGARLAAGRDGVRWVARVGAPVARLVIPRLGLDEVVVEGVDDAELRAGPGHMIGTVVPGDTGNSVISAHRDRHFRPLRHITVGDTLITESDRGQAVWRVSRVDVVSADARALRETAVPTLTLTTCWPIRYFGPAPERLIVTAERVRDS